MISAVWLRSIACIRYMLIRLQVGSWRNGSAPAWHAGGCGFKKLFDTQKHENPAESTNILGMSLQIGVILQENVFQHGRFRKKVENFVCDHCGFYVEGNGYTDHCPYCLWSKHVDINPGDRLSECKGSMKPVAAEYKRGQYKIFYKCQKCGEEKQVTASENDNKELLVELATKPIRISRR